MSLSFNIQANIAVVVIGRNEGERLKRCLRSLIPQCKYIVYVDSGSSDGSIECAKSIGVDVIELDTSRPFTMARGRNTGASHILNSIPDIEFIQFIDGDCEVDENWIRLAVQTLQNSTNAAVVCGRRRERFPNVSAYNRLIDMEWDTPIGEIRNCGGDSMMRAAVFLQVGGFNEIMIAGEEPELCVRIRNTGGTILRIDEEMTLHDASMTRFGQWWKRAVRGGHAYAGGAAIHGRGPTRHNVREVRSTLFWGAILPILFILFCVTSALLTPVLLTGVLMIVLIYAVQWYRITKGCQQRGFSAADANLYATFCLLGKLAGVIGIIIFWFNRLRGKRTELMEYRQGEMEVPQSPALRTTL